MVELVGNRSILIDINGNIVIGMVINQVYREAARSVVYFTHHKVAEAEFFIHIYVLNSRIFELYCFCTSKV